MTLEEKIGQMLQVSGMFYTDDGVLTGPENTAGYTEEEIRVAGSVLLVPILPTVSHVRSYCGIVWAFPTF